MTRLLDAHERREHPALYRDGARKAWLATKRTELAMATIRFKARLRDVYHPITLTDGSYWRNGKWNKRPPVKFTWELTVAEAELKSGFRIGERIRKKSTGDVGVVTEFAYAPLDGDELRVRAHIYGDWYMSGAPDDFERADA